MLPVGAGNLVCTLNVRSEYETRNIEYERMKTSSSIKVVFLLFSTSPDLSFFLTSNVRKMPS